MGTALVDGTIREESGGSQVGSGGLVLQRGQNTQGVPTNRQPRPYHEPPNMPIGSRCDDLEILNGNAHPRGCVVTRPSEGSSLSVPRSLYAPRHRS
jgi:hypothetical protein